MESDIEASSGLSIIRANRRAYLVINIVYYGLVLCGITVAALYPSVQHRMLRSSRAPTYANTILGAVAKVYESRNVPRAAVVTFLINSIVGAFASITLPSALIPFSGFVVGLSRPAIWGLWFSSGATRTTRVTLFPLSLTLLMEGQAYVLAIFGCYLWGRWVVHPNKDGFATRRAAYLAGLRANMQLYGLIIVTLAVSAVYEAVAVIGAMRLPQH